MRTRSRMGRGLAGLAVLAVLVAGCSGGAEDAGETQETVGRADGDVGSDAAPGGPAETEAAGEPGATSAGGESTGSGDAEQQSGDTVPDATAGRDIVYRASVTLSSNDPDETADRVRDLASDTGGFVSGTELSRDELGLLRGSITIRVPAENLDRLLDRVSSAAAEVTDLQQRVEDVTGQIADIEARLRNLRALEEELRTLLTEAREGGDTDDVLDVFNRLGEIRGEIETLEGRRTELSEQVALSTLTVRIEPTAGLVASRRGEPDDDQPLPWSPRNVVATAWDATVTALQGFVDAVIRTVVLVLPVTLVWASPLLVVLLVARWWRRRHDGRPGTPPAPGHDPRRVPPAPGDPTDPAPGEPTDRVPGEPTDQAPDGDEDVAAGRERVGSR